MTIALIDDLRDDLEVLFDYICRYCQERRIHVHIEKFISELAFLRSANRTAYDLVFLDIYMQQASGIQVAQKLREKHPKCQIIFTTASKDYAVKAFRLQALDYLVKPYTYELLTEACNRYEQVAAKFAHYIELKEGRHYTRVLISDIIYTDYHNHYIQIHTSTCQIRSYMSFGEFAPMLDPYPQFLWCYRNCMVNMDYIESFDSSDFILNNGERLPIAKARKQEITQAYANYIFDYVNGGTTL